MASVSRPVVLIFLLLSLVTVRAADPASTLPPRVVAPTDTAVFRRLVLDNGLRVILVSDPKFNKSAASLVVNVGQIDDPADREGLAHFLEHMLFLGTEKYPDVAEYGNYMTANGGSKNAYTSSDHTNYQFEVRHEAFAGGLDRLAQFFISPLFTPEFTERELNAVHNEAMRHVQNDQRRVLGVARSVYAPGSGESKFSTGNKDTLAGTTPAIVRAFYEATYSTDRMALSLAGKASLDELEQYARRYFSPIPRREIPPVTRKAEFLPRRAALRLAYAEPVKELRQLQLEFVIPPTRPDFASKPDELVSQLISYPGPGGLLDWLKREGLANDAAGGVWARTGAYGSFLLTVTLTPAGLQDHPRVLGAVMSYLRHLRTAPFPLDFFRDRARVAALRETYTDRGEGSTLAVKLANQALFYPLEVAERATDAWGEPDEAAYRRLLDVLTPDNMLAILVAKGLPTDRKERIYGTAFSYREDAGPAYTALLNPPALPFALPGTNRFMPGDSALLAERPFALISEPGLRLYYAPDTEFQRPESSLIYRFVPVRALASADTAALLQLYSACLNDALDAASGEAALAGLQFSTSATLEGLRLSATGFGDAPVRFATHVASQLRTFPLSPARFEAVKEAVLRGLRSFNETEAYLMARARNDALSRQHEYLPDELISRVTTATWADVQAFAQKFFAAGAIEGVVHGHLPPEAAAAATRSMVAAIGARPAPEAELLRRRHLALAPGEHVVDAGPVNGANSTFYREYLLNDDRPETRAAALLLSNYFSREFFSELRTRQQLGYIVGASAGASLRQRKFTFVIQSSTHASDELKRRAEAFLDKLPENFAAISDAQWTTLVAGARSTFEQKPKSISEKAGQFFSSAFDYDGEWERRQDALRALGHLTKARAAALLQSALAPATSRTQTLLLDCAKLPPATPTTPTFGDRAAWKASRRFE